MISKISNYVVDSKYDNSIKISSDNKCGIGINLVNNPDKSIFYLKETLDYHKVIKWFTVQ